MILQAIVFDLDGVVAETEDLHRQAYNLAFEQVGVPTRWSFDDYKQRLHRSAGSKLEEISPPNPAAAPQEFRKEVYDLKRKNYLDLLVSSPLPPRPGVVRLIEEAEGQGIRLAAASTCAREGAQAILSKSLEERLASRFEVLKAGEDASRRKPDPEIYLLALAALGLPPTVCVAIEDTRHGLESAKGAGLATLVTPSDYTRGERFEEADWVVADLDTGRVGVWELDKMLAKTLQLPLKG